MTATSPRVCSRSSQLQNALSQITPDVNAYSPGFRTEVDREIARWRAGGCATAAAKPAGSTLRIVKVQPKGGAKRESVTIKNTGRKAIKLKGYVLRDAADHKIKFMKTTLKAGRSLRVVTGCRKGSKRAVRKGTRYYACRTKQFWDDEGDVVELVNPKGGLLSRKRTARRRPDAVNAPSAGPGWYPDPQGTGSYRYWDGTRWTDALSSAIPPAATASSDTTTWAMAAHLTALAALFIGLPFVGPLIIYLRRRTTRSSAGMPPRR